MSDVAISYASATRDQTLHLADSLRAAGLDVWMDDAARLDVAMTDIGVPAGQRHWEVISAAIDRASLLLVLDSRPWRESQYCWDEYRHAIAAGKRISVIRLDDVGEDSERPRPTWPADSIDHVQEQVRDDETVVDAHTRLLVAARTDGSLWWGSATLTHHARDVEILAASDLPALGLKTTSEIASLSDQVVKLTRRRRRLVRGSAAALVAVLAAVAVVAVMFQRSASAAQDRAVEELGFRRSLEYAGESRAAVASSDRLALADAAVEAAPTATARAASAAAEAFVAERSRFETTVSGTPSAVALSDDARMVAVLTIAGAEATRTVAVYHVEGGARSWSADVPLVTAPELALGPGATSATVAARDGSQLVTVGVETETIQTKSVVAFGYREGRLWWAEASGDVVVLDPDRGGRRLLVAVGEPISAVAMDPATSAPVVLTRDGRLRRFVEGPMDRYRPDGAGAVRLFDGPRAVDEDDDDVTARTDGLLVCDRLIIAFRPEGWVSVDRDGTQQRGTAGTTLERQSWSGETRACLDDGAVRIQLAGRPDAVPTGRPIPFPLVGTARHGRYPLARAAEADSLAIVQPDGIVDVLSLGASPVTRDSANVVAILPFAERMVLVEASGLMVAIGSRLDGEPAPFGNLGGPPTDSFPTRVGDAWLIGVETGYAEVLPDGTTIVHNVDQRGRLRPTADRTALMAVGPDVVELQLGVTDDIVRRTTIAGLEPGEELHDADDLSVEALAVTTTRGRVLVVDRFSGEVFKERRGAPSGQTPMVVTADGSIITAGADGIVRAFDAELRLLRSTIIGPPVFDVSPSHDGTRLLATTFTADAHVLDASTLGPAFSLTDQPEARVYQLADGDRTVMGLSVDSSDDGYEAAVTVFPLPKP